MNLSYLNLLNPFATFFNSGKEPGSAPKGRFRLAENDKLNYAAWNTLGTAAWMIPAALLISRLSNKNAHDDIKKRMSEALAERLHASRPTVSGTANTEDDVVNMLDKELNRRVNREMSKEASDDSYLGQVGKTLSATWNELVKPSAKSVQNWAETGAGKVLTYGIAPAMPIAIPALVALLAARAHNKSMKAEVKEALLQDRERLKKEQRAIDRIMLESQGLIKSAEAGAEAGKSILFSPLTLAFLLAGGTGILGYKFFRKADDSSAKVKVLKDRILGSSPLQDTPKITLAELPAAVAEMTAVPGSSKKETLAIADPVSGAIEELTNKGDIVDVDPILEEVTAKKPKKDAIF